MDKIATVSFLLWSLGALGAAFVATALSMGLAAALKKAWPLAFAVIFKIIAALSGLAFSLSAVLNVAVFLIHVAKAN